MFPWTTSPLFRTAAGTALVLAAAVLLGAPSWILLLALAGAAALLSFVAIREHEHKVGIRQRAQEAVERLAEQAGIESGASLRRIEDLPRRLDTLADELAARLESAHEAQSIAAARLAAFPEPILVIDASDEIKVCNAPACQMLNLPCSRVVGRPVEEVFTHAELLQVIARARRGSAVRVQVRIPTAEGVRTWQVAAAPARAEDVVVSLRDATEEARALQVKTDFVGNASHELRTPIAALRTAVETLSSLESDEPEMRQRLMRMITDNIARLEEMARDLLDLSRVESPEAPVRIREVRASELASQLAEMFEGVCRERGISLQFDLAPELESMRTDPDLLSLVLRNLIDNATRFAFEGTAVRVVGRIFPHPDGRSARFEVIDRGPGIPLAAQQRIFERYFQVDIARTTTEHRRGSGLGLAIVKHATRRLGGTVRVHSVWQQGTTMTVELPETIADKSPESAGSTDAQ